MQARDRRLEQPPVHVEEDALLQGIGQQIERRVDLVAGGFQLQATSQPGAPLAALAPLELNGRLLLAAIGTAAPLGLVSAILALRGHGLRICSVPRQRASIALPCRLCTQGLGSHLPGGRTKGETDIVARQQHGVERRLLPPRRSDSERRLGDRRLEVISLDDERRDHAARRRASDRRQAVGRRQMGVRGDKLVVLVVSDQEIEARRIRDLLSGADADRFAVAAAAPEASLARLARGGVDVVLLAMSLSAHRGFATFTELRTLAPAVPFLFLSDAEDERNGLEAVRAGAQDFLVKSDVDGPVLAHALRLAIERNRLHAALLDLALVDDLTGLYNRRGFLTLATRDLRLARRGNETLLVAFADLDDLKGVNDSAGHAVGDRALRDAAALLRQTFRDSDLVARIGGDEYAVLVRHAGPESAGVLADRLKRQVREFNRRAARPYRLSISLGFATHKASTLGSVAGLLDRADRALYRDKRRKHGAG